MYAKNVGKNASPKRYGREEIGISKFENGARKSAPKPIV